MNPMYLSSRLSLVLVIFCVACATKKDGAIELNNDDRTEATDLRSTEEAGAPNDTADSLSTDGAASSDDDTGGTGADQLDAALSGSTDDTHETDPVTSTADASTAADIEADAATNVSGEDGTDLLEAGVWDASWPAVEACVYHSDAVPLTLASDAGTDAGSPPGPHVLLGDNSFLGPILTDGQGYTLYIYTADLPGDCENPPISTCFDDCVLSWPIYEAGRRELGEGLDDSQFGTFVREDGVRQTTYQGWPLYYYIRDKAPGDAVGQGRGKVWYIAETTLPNLLIMRASEELEGVRYLSDGRGRTLYAYEGDDLGSETRIPRSNCVGECRENFRPFTVRSLYPVSELEPDDVSVFSTGRGLEQQVSYQGRPLYLANDDERSGDMNGLGYDAFSLVEP